MNNPYREHISMVEKHIVRNNPVIKYFYRKQPSGKVFLEENNPVVKCFCRKWPSSKVFLQKITQQ